MSVNEYICSSCLLSCSRSPQLRSRWQGALRSPAPPFCVRVCVHCQSVSVEGRTKTDPKGRLAFDSGRLCIKPMAKDFLPSFSVISEGERNSSLQRVLQSEVVMQLRAHCLELTCWLVFRGVHFSGRTFFSPPSFFFYCTTLIWNTS